MTVPEIVHHKDSRFLTYRSVNVIDWIISKIVIPQIKTQNRYRVNHKVQMYKKRLKQIVQYTTREYEYSR